jgi:hypothetical protein
MISLKTFLAAIALAFAAHPVAGWAATIDFSATGQDDDVTCASVANVSYCDNNKFLYGWVADYILLSEYDYYTYQSFTAAPGTTFTPQSIDILSASQSLVRAFCDLDCQSMTPDEFASTYPDRFSLISSLFLNVTGMKNGQTIANTQVDPTGLAALTFGSAFAGIDMLTIALAMPYPVPYDMFDLASDGYVYGCQNGPPCYVVTLDNFTFTPGDVQPAPVPLPATGVALIGALGAMGAFRLLRRR